MSFRIEHKIKIDISSLMKFKSWITKNGAKRLHPDRIVNSIYYDNFKHEMYHDSIEGICPRKKIRIRNYPNDKSQKFFFEKKISSPDGRFKEKKNLDIKEFELVKKFGYFDDLYKSCHPKLFVEYLREYYDANICRLTIDTNIRYTNFKRLNYNKSDPYIAVEIKANIQSDLDKLMSEFPFQRVRFSKYCRGFDFLFS